MPQEGQAVRLARTDHAQRLAGTGRRGRPIPPRRASDHANALARSRGETGRPSPTAPNPAPETSRTRGVEVGMWLTPDPVAVEPSTRVSEAARLMALRHVR